MMQSATDFAEEDIQLCEDNHLGELQDVYRLKLMFFLGLCVVASIYFIAGIGVLIGTFTYMYHAYPDSLYIDLIVSAIALLYGLYFASKARRAQHMRVLICERGLLQVQKTIRRNQVDKALWHNILTLTPYDNSQRLVKGFQIYYLQYHPQPRAVLVLSNHYQNFDELVALITERSEEFIEANKDKRSGPIFPLHKDGEKQRCPCCGYKTLNERGEFEVCPVCFWQDDGSDDGYLNIDQVSFPNNMSLKFARETYQKYGATQKRGLEFVRPPLPEEM